MNLAPIALFVYNRSWHTKQTIEALKNNKLATDSDLIIFSDGPKNNDLNQQQVNKVRKYLKTISGFKNIKIVERLENYGLAKSIIIGVTEVINNYGRVIVIEDDLITSRYFLNYMNETLNLYKNDNEVISIHGFIYPIKEKLPETFFLRGADCWGWATWKRGWNLFETNGQKLLDELETKRLTQEFDFNNSYPFTQMLRDQIKKRNNSWAIRWYASAFLKNKLTLYPGQSLIKNIGFDNSGTHCNGINKINSESNVENIKIKVEKIKIIKNFKAHLLITNYFWKQNNFLIRCFRFLKRILKYSLKINK
ncbi:MAG: glycosyltransferase family 2 protein [Patescibacteria group bacterium]|nr:glycosyltransferase [Patescibacteria group bacterium]MBU0879219.1 glycosyltransferase [Patescibacteria group bacterium]MBU0880096.1 glycosyltransferase [Patescibacteria group bacterium]MBU1062845.1 glycosyltransferase [Patescibacteria group bacterium]MBU1783490.1 glycosyltransferase [Patescibacteria group bacterium]